MTVRETGVLERLRQAIEECNRNVTQVLEREVADRKEIDKLDAAVNGDPSDQNSPGLKELVRSLVQSRTYLQIGMKCTWGVILLIVGALLRQAFGG